MKRFLFLLLFPVLLCAQSTIEDSADAKWLTNYDKALKKSKKEDKNVLIYFTGSDWCPPCKMLKSDLFETSEFKSLADNYILLYIDMPRNQDLLSKEQYNHNKELLPKLNKKGVFPLLKIINSKGAVLDEYSGYAMNGEVKYHLDLLKNNL
ncbi:thioredoxin family protein [uncultured Maribacter sp.]|uniref:thioredoxin family protein n=1 Tax=uncultured Maribacter sp. TaxID=431308 RepID=UPI00260F56D1|nr:thioredoxin family protein [uncultured Maribacter sp.]